MSNFIFSYSDQNILTREKLIERVNNGEEFDSVLFYGRQDYLSQFYPCSFTVNGVTYSSAEQYMMAGKAKLFKDEEILQKILETDVQLDIKRLGRKIKNFDEEAWNKYKRQIVFYGNVHKFRQNEELKNFLLSTGDAILVEASPFDKIWGIGIGKEQIIHALHPSLWKGQNLLGFILMEVREQLRLTP